jgi:Domain of unknown function (DUF3883)
LIELIQNADDAGASIFGLHEFHSGFVVGNNGRPFTSQDVEALCRSGSSNKSRGGATIGYRGIGFKSVVNLAKEIHVLSGDFAFFFNKDCTQKKVKQDIDVPLIRVPHTFIREGSEFIWDELVEFKNTHSYQTIFFFDALDKRISIEDISGFDRSSLLFLNNLRLVRLNYEAVSRTISMNLSSDSAHDMVALSEGNERDCWEVISGNESDSKLAFKVEDGEIVPALPGESLIYSFTPTVEFSGAYIKVNGDYTTDPSRKRIDLDDKSHAEFSNVANIISMKTTSIFNGKSIRKGFFSPFVNIQERDSRFKKILFENLSEQFSKAILCSDATGDIRFSDIRLRPDWLDYEDYEILCSSGLMRISKNLLLSNPNLVEFLESLDVKFLTLQEILERVNLCNISLTGIAQIFVKVIKQYRYDLDENRLKFLKTIKLFPVGELVLSADEIQPSSKFCTDFTSYVLENVDEPDVRTVLKKLVVGNYENLISSDKTSMVSVEAHKALPHASDQNDLSSLSQNNLPKKFRAEPAIKKWRNAEQNVAEYLRSLNGVLSVSDVGQANLGYDLDVMCSDGSKFYVEVKSVSSFSEPFKVTSNEYATAHRYSEKYCIALVVHNESFEVKIIINPILTARFEKKIEKWCWFCQDYRDILSDFSSGLFHSK